MLRQIYLGPVNKSHTLEVAQNARTIARALYLNEDLTEAIALGHDLGHTPFGHAIQPEVRTVSQYLRQIFRNVLLPDNPCTDGIINIRVDVGNLI